MIRAALLLAPFALLPAAQPKQQQPVPKPAEVVLKAPPVVTPGPSYGMAPSDAVMLVDGKSFDKWTTRDGKAMGWKPGPAKSGDEIVCVPGAGDIVTKESFGDMQLHVEFKTPTEQGEGQDRGNSGVYIQGRYEVQVLDSYKNETYPDGQCGAVYKQHVPLVNACRPQGEWQTYDIVFRAPKFDAGGKKTANAFVTVIHNGVLIQDHAEITGPTGGAMGQEEKATGPLLLQEHGHSVSYRNVWVRKI